jgi:thioesterase domain-containing protein
VWAEYTLLGGIEPTSWQPLSAQPDHCRTLSVPGDHNDLVLGANVAPIAARINALLGVPSPEALPEEHVR